MENYELVSFVEKEIIESEFADATLEDFHPYQQELIKRFGFDIHNFNSIINLGIECRASLFLNFYADAQLALFENYLKNKYKKQFTDVEAMEIAYKMKYRIWDKVYRLSFDKLDSYERSRVYNDFSILRRLNEKNVLFHNPNVDRVLEDSTRFEFSGIEQKYYVLFNLKNKYELLSIGLEKFIDDVVPLIFEMPDSCADDELFPFMIWEDNNSKVLKKD